MLDFEIHHQSVFKQSSSESYDNILNTSYYNNNVLLPLRWWSGVGYAIMSVYLCVCLHVSSITQQHVV